MSPTARIGMVLRACYALPGTDVAYDDTHSLCAIGTNIALNMELRYLLRTCYAMSGTDVRYRSRSGLPFEPKSRPGASLSGPLRVAPWRCPELAYGLRQYQA
eukprot:3834542-Rhodomonas_salina.2